MLDSADRDHVFGCARRDDRVGVSRGAGRTVTAAVACRKHKKQRLRTGLGRQGVADGGVIAGCGQVILVSAAVLPTVVGNECVCARGSLLEVNIRSKERHREKFCAGRLAPELAGDDRGDRACGIGDCGGVNAAAGDDARHMGAMPVAVHQEARVRPERIRNHPAGKVRMTRVDARVVDVYQHVGAGEPEVVFCGNGICGNCNCNAAPVVCGNAFAGQLDNLHARNAGDARQGIRLGTNRDDRAERRTSLINDFGAHSGKRVDRGSGLTGKKQHSQKGVFRQQFHLRSRSEQRGFQFVVGFVGQHCLRLAMQGVSNGFRACHQVGIVWNVGNDLCSRRRQHRSKFRCGLPLCLNNPCAGLITGAQVGGKRQVKVRPGINQRVLEQHGRRRACQLTNLRLGVAQPVGETQRAICR